MEDNANIMANDRGEIQTDVTKVTLPGDVARQATSTQTTDDTALGNQNEQAQKDENKTNQGAAGTGSDPLNNVVDDTKQPEVKTEGQDTVDSTKTTGNEIQDSEIKLDENGIPEASAPIDKVREWGKGLLADVNSFKPVIEKVQELGGVKKLELASQLYDSLASPNYEPDAVLNALAEMSPGRYEALINKAFEKHEDKFLNSLGLNVQQFKTAAKAVLEGRSVTEDDITGAQIPFGISSETWERMSEEEQAAVKASAKEATDAKVNAARIASEQKLEVANREQEKWANSLESAITEICDSYKIPSDTEDGKDMRERIRRSVYSTLSSDTKAAEKFYASLKYFNDGEVGFALALQPQLENFVKDFATKEAEYYNENKRLKDQIAVLKLSNAGNRIEVKGNDSKEGISINRGTGNSLAGTDISPDKLFDRDSLHDSAAQVTK